jgi:hypothetical protein
LRDELWAYSDSVANPLCVHTQPCWQLLQVIRDISCADLFPGSEAKQGLDRSSSVHGVISLGGPVKWQFEVEDLAPVYLALPNQVD